jgi:hypothetical protein
VFVTLIGITLLVIMIWAMSTGTNAADFLAKMRASPYGTHGNTDDELVQMGRNVCGAFDSGTTAKQIAFSFWGMSEQQRGWLMGAAVSTMCTQHQGTLISEINAY